MQNIGKFLGYEECVSRMEQSPEYLECDRIPGGTFAAVTAKQDCMMEVQEKSGCLDLVA